MCIANRSKRRSCPEDIPDMLKAIVITNDNFDYCGCSHSSFHFWKSCYSMIFEKKLLKFRSANCIDVLFCQKYLNFLCNLSLIKEIFITCVYPIIFIRKFGSNKTDSTVLYHWI